MDPVLQQSHLVTGEFNSGNPDDYKNSWKQRTSSVQAREFFIGPPASKAKADAGNGYVPKQVLTS